MEQADWQGAAAAFGSVTRPDNAVELRRRLAQNLADLQQYRPEIYQSVVAAIPDSRFKIVRAKRGRLSIAPSDSQSSLSPGNDPLENVLQTFSTFHTYIAARQPIALCGIGDGWVLQALAESSDDQQVILIFEPDPHLLLANLAIHDYCIAIKRPDYFWFVGPDWAEKYRQAILSNPNLPSPVVNILQGESGGDIEAAMVEARGDQAQ